VVTDAARHDGALLPDLIDKDNTASDVWADTAYRSKANEKHLADNGLRSQIHRKKPKGKPMSRRAARANGRCMMVQFAAVLVLSQEHGEDEAHSRDPGRDTDQPVGAGAIGDPVLGPVPNQFLLRASSNETPSGGIGS
jgi:hypothetical protein